MKKKETLCKWDKEDISNHFEELIKMIEKPEFVCKKCARASRKPDNLCKPAPIK